MTANSIMTELHQTQGLTTKAKVIQTAESGSTKMQTATAFRPKLNGNTQPSEATRTMRTGTAMAIQATQVAMYLQGTTERMRTA